MSGGDPTRQTAPADVSTALASSSETFDEIQRRIRDHAPAAVNREGVATAGDLDEFGDAFVALLAMESRFGDGMRDGVVALPEMISIGPRSGFSLSTFASVHGFRFAVAAWKSGAPDAGTA